MGRKKKKKTKPKKFIVSLSAKQYELLKQYSNYTKKSSGSIIKKSISIYLKQISRDLECWKKINHVQSSLYEADEKKQMKIEF